MERLYGKPFDSGSQVQRWKVKGLLVGFRKPRKDVVLAPAARENGGFSRVSVAGEGVEA